MIAQSAAQSVLKVPPSACSGWEGLSPLGDTPPEREASKTTLSTLSKAEKAWENRLFCTVRAQSGLLKVLLKVPSEHFEHFEQDGLFQNSAPAIFRGHYTREGGAYAASAPEEGA